MFYNYTDQYRRLCFAFIAMLLLAFGQSARAADYTAGVDNIDGAATLWFQGAAGITQSIAHYNVNGGAQQNVVMAFNSARARHELGVQATAGQTVNFSFTYTKNGLAYDSPPGSAVVPSVANPGQVVTPVFSPPPGSYSAAQQVTVSSATAGATLQCSINGAAQAACVNPINVAANSTITAFATKAGMSNSVTASATYTIGMASGPYTQGVADNGTSLTIWFAGTPKSDWVDVHYTLNGTGQQNVAMSYSGTRHEVNLPVAASAAASLAYSFTYMTATGARDATGFTWTRGGTTGTVATPVISPAGGSFGSAQSVTLSTTTSGAAIRYTLDGSAPGINSALYGGAFTVAAPGATVKAIALKSGMNNSAVASAVFTISQIQTVANPVITPAGGTFSSAQSVHLSSATSGAAIWYSLNGAAQQLYSDAAPINVAASGTLMALARKSGMNDSASVSASYTINSGNGETFTQGVAEDGATARIWFAPGWTPSTAIAHSYVTGKDGVKGTQHDENMSYDSVLKRWQAPAISPISTGSKISYMFTYSAPTGGNKDSAWFDYVVCGDDAPDSPACPSPVAKPTFLPAGGLYPTQQSVTLNLPTGSVAGTKIYYTIDGSAPGTNSRQYLAGTPLLVKSATTINAIAVRPDQQQSRRASATYDIAAACTQTPAGCTVAAPSLSHASGSYATRIGVNMLTLTPGATVHYTKDGSTPTRTSPQFNGAVWLAKSPELGDTFTLKALATKDGADSSIVTRTYTISDNAESPWNGMTSFNVVNGTGGKFTDDKVYWLIIGKDWITHEYVRADQNGHLIPVSEADNVIPVPDRDKGYANYSVSLAQAKSVTIPPIESARVYMSVGKPVLVQINRDINGQTGYAGPDLGNSTDPNLNTTFDFGEFNINRPRPASDNPGIYVNTSRVDIFGFPLKLRVTGLDGYDATVGETLTETRDELFARFILETPSEFAGLAKAPYAPYRIMAPGHGTFNDGLDVKTGAHVKPSGENAAYLDAYISDVWNKYRNEDLVLKVGDWPIFTGRVGVDDVFTFTDGIDSYKIFGKPTTTEVMLGNGLLDDATGTVIKTPKHDKQLQLQAQLCAALNRHVADQPSERWYNADFFYPVGKPSNFFTKFWHRHSYNGLAYGFSYDDVGGHSPSIYTPSPVSVTYTIGQ